MSTISVELTKNIMHTRWPTREDENWSIPAFPVTMNRENWDFFLTTITTIPSQKYTYKNWFLTNSTDALRQITWPRFAYYVTVRFLEITNPDRVLEKNTSTTVNLVWPVPKKKRLRSRIKTRRPAEDRSRVSKNACFDRVIDRFPDQECYALFSCPKFIFVKRKRSI